MKSKLIGLVVLNFFLFSTILNAQADVSTAKNTFTKIKNEYGLTTQDIQSPHLSNHYISKHNQVHHFYFNQTYAGIPVYNAHAGLHFARNQELITHNCDFVSEITQKVNTTEAILTPIEAVQEAAKHLGIRFTGELNVLETIETSPLKVIVSPVDLSLDKISVKQVYQLTKDDEVRLAWDLVIETVDYENWWSVRIDAVNGDLLDKIDWIVECDWGEKCDGVHDHHQPNQSQEKQEICVSDFSTEQVKVESEPSFSIGTSSISSNTASVVPYNYRVYAYPVESPNHGARTLQVDPWTPAGLAGTLGWHDDGTTTYTILRGNNVWAQEDRDGNNGVGASPNSSTNNYDYPVNLNNNPSTYTDAATTNLFYWNNLMHDVWYQYGFDEASGNFQEDNLGRGGAGSDYVNADCQDGSGTNNANFGTPADGGNPRMQMFEWTSGATIDFVVNSPGGVAGSYQSVQAAFGASLPVSPSALSGNLVVVNDGTAAPTEACSPITNGAAVNGNIAIIDRGNCNFIDKVINAENVGAIACIVCNNVAGGPITMGNGGNGTAVNIPAVMISQADCAAIRAAIPTVNVSLSTAGGSSSIDGDFDNGIIAHEYGHGISTRLTGGPANAGCLGNEEQMGEGWSDWFGMWMTIEPGDAASDIRGVGTFATNQPTNGTGIRPAPYTTNTSVNAYTYGDLCNAEVSVPHGVGFVWSTMLWDLTWEFINVYGFDPDIYSGTGGNNIVAQLIMDGMKLQPCSPGFVDGRDAILQADQVNNGGANQCLIWNVFAARGLGFSADQGASTSRCDGTEAFDLPAICSSVLSFSKTADNSTVDVNGTITFTLTAENFTPNAFTGVVLTDNLPADLVFVPGSESCPATINGNTITFNPVTVNSGAAHSCTFQAMPSGNNYSTFSFFDDHENGNANWTVTDLGGTGYNWANNTSNTYSPGNAWYGVDIDAISDIALTLTTPVTISGTTPQLRFYHYYDTEATWDGGVVEISTNGGTSWTDLGPFMTQNGYNNTMQVNAASAISGQDAFTGSSLQYIETVVDLSSFNGQNVVVRFRMVNDEFVSADGWYIDDIMFIDAVELVNTACVSTDQGDNSCDSETVLVTGKLCDAVIEIAELCDGSTATLDGSNSTALGAIAYNWSTPDGNILSGGTTATPIVDADGTYILNITSGTCTDSDTLYVTVDPLQMTLVGKLPYTSSLSDIWGYTDANGIDYALVGLYDGFSIVSLADPSNPVEMHNIPGVGITWRDVKTWGDYAYVINEASAGGGLLIIDMANLTSDPATSAITTYTTDFGIGYTDCHNIFIDEVGRGFLFGATCSATIPGTTGTKGTLIIDIASNPTNPPYTGVYPQYDIISGMNTYIHDGFVRGDTLWASHIYDGTFGVVDISNIGTLPNGVLTANELLAVEPTPGAFTHACWLSDDGSTLITLDEKGGNTSLGINSFDVSNINNITYLDNVESFPGTNVVPHNVFIKGNFAVISYYTSGVVIADFSDPTNLVIVESYDTSPNYTGTGFNGCWGVYPFFDSGLIIASDRQEGLYVLSANCTPASLIEGTVTDSADGSPIPGATIDVLNYSGEETTTNQLGNYATGIAYCGVFDVVFSAPCYESDTISVTFVNDALVIVDAELTYNCCIPPTATLTPNGSTDICQGDAVTLTGGPAGMTYLWSDGSTTQSINASTPGDYYVIVADATGCADTSVVIKVDNYPTPATPTISPNGAVDICAGDVITLTSSAGSSYLWSTGATTQSIIVNSTGFYNVQITDANGCLSPSSASTVVTVNANPDASFNTLASNYCVQDNAISLIPVTAGGTFSGPGVTGNQFDPGAVPASMWGQTITIRHSVTINGCLGTFEQDVIVDNCITPGLQLAVRMYLEGSFESSTGQMRTTLNQEGLLPNAQPYSGSPWFYAGTETITTFPANVVDWVLIELRAGTPNLGGTTQGTTIVESIAGLLLANGDVIMTNGQPLTFNNLSAGTDYYVVARHRNHLDVISSNSITGNANMTYDFTTGTNMAMGTQQTKQMAAGQFALYAGDYEVDGIIQTSDYNVWKTSASILYIYAIHDGNMDGTVQTTDYDIWKNNGSILGPVEIRY